MTLAMLIFGDSTFTKEAKSTPKAASLLRWNVTGCIGDFDVLNTDVMGECTSYRIPAPASIHTEYKNQTTYCSYHYQGDTECQGSTRTLVMCLDVGHCQNFTDFGDIYSQKRVWKY